MIGKNAMPGMAYLSVVQLLAAIAVIYSHSYPLADGNGGGALILRGAMPWGSAAVDVFFMISGFMVCESFGLVVGVRARIFESVRFFVKRSARILPVIWFSTIVALFILGPWFTTLPLNDYFASEQFWDYFANFNPFSVRFFLPGVFESNFNHGVNGSLWVIPWLMWCYVMMMAFGIIGKHRNKFVVTLLCSVVGAIYLRQDSIVPHGATFMGLPIIEGVRLIAFFICGWTWRVWFDDVVNHGILAFGLFATLAIWLTTPAQDLAMGIIVGYSLVSLLKCQAPSIIKRVPRISFGIFVLGFMVQQGFVASFGGRMNHWLNFGLSMLVTVPLAYLEMWTIERLSSVVRNYVINGIDAMEMQFFDLKE